MSRRIRHRPHQLPKLTNKQRINRWIRNGHLYKTDHTAWRISMRTPRIEITGQQQ